MPTTLPSGFVQRVKGKVSFGGMMPFQEQIVETIVSTGGNYAMYPGGVSILRSTVAPGFFTLPIPEPGTVKTFIVSTMSSAHVAIRTNSTGAGGVYVDSTSFTMLAPSTTVPGILTWRLMAVSSILWVTIGNSTVGSTAGWGTSS